MRLMQTRQRLVVVTLWLVLSLVACGAPPTSAVTATSEDAGVQEAQPSATPTPTPKPTQPPLKDPLPSPTPTPTPTPPVSIQLSPSPAASACEGLSGQIEVKILVGPADAVGLEPVAVGTVPFAVVSNQAPYLVEGVGALFYDEVLVEEWGTYAVTLNMNAEVSGDCTGLDGSERLLLTLEASGDQLVVVDAGEFYGEYPWSGTQTFPLDFPLEEGATVEGEGYTFVLHLSGQ